MQSKGCICRIFHTVVQGLLGGAPGLQKIDLDREGINLAKMELCLGYHNPFHPCKQKVWSNAIMMSWTATADLLGYLENHLDVCWKMEDNSTPQLSRR